MPGSNRPLGYAKYPITKHSAPQASPYRFPASGTQKAVKPTSQPSTLAPQVTPEVREINGQPVQSEEEWNIYKALLYLGVPRHAIDYQVPFRGGRAYGGQILDFVVDLGGSPVIIRMMGGHWHPGEYGTAADVFGFGQLLQAGYIVRDISDRDARDFRQTVQTLQRLNLF